MMRSESGFEQGVLVLWERALEFRGATSRRLIPRAAAHAVHLDDVWHERSFVLSTAGADIQVIGAHIGPVGHRIADWLGAPSGAPFSCAEPVLGGGPATLGRGNTAVRVHLSARPGQVLVSEPGRRAARWSLPWEQIDASIGAPSLPLAGTSLTGQGLAAVQALALGGAPYASGGVRFVAEVELGWMRLPHALAVSANGLAWVPVGRWAQLWSGPRSVVWSDVLGLERDGPQSIRLRTKNGALRMTLPEASGLRAELRRQMLAAARTRDRAAEAQGRDTAGWVVQVRRADTQSWCWGRLDREGSTWVVRRQTTQDATHRLDAQALRWWPQLDQPLTLVLEVDGRRIHLRPACGQRFLRDWTRWMGAPELLEDPVVPMPPRPLSRGGRRRDTRIPLALNAWLDPFGRIPDVTGAPPTHTLELAMSSAVVRWPSTLPVGREVGLALDLGGLPLATRALVVRQVGPQMWALQLRQPPAAMVHRIGSRVRAHERAALTANRTGGVPLSLSG